MLPKSLDNFFFNQYSVPDTVAKEAIAKVFTHQNFRSNFQSRLTQSHTGQGPIFVLFFGCGEAHECRYILTNIKKLCRGKGIIALGIDIDPKLIATANEYFRNIFIENVSFGFQCINGVHLEEIQRAIVKLKSDCNCPPDPFVDCVFFTHPVVQNQDCKMVLSKNHAKMVESFNTMIGHVAPTLLRDQGKKSVLCALTTSRGEQRLFAEMMVQLGLNHTRDIYEATFFPLPAEDPEGVYPQPYSCASLISGVQITPNPHFATMRTRPPITTDTYIDAGLTIALHLPMVVMQRYPIIPRVAVVFMSGVLAYLALDMYDGQRA
jgi:hypothetical protein